MGMWGNVSPAIDEAMRGTEREIMNAALDEDDQLPEFENDADDSLEQTESFDGTPSDLDELAYIAEHGHSDSGFDRPLALAEGQAYEHAIAQRDQYIAGLQQQNVELAYRLDPNVQSRETQENDVLLNSVIEDGGTAVRNHINGLNAQLQNMRADRVNASLSAQHRDHGSRFEQAYAYLTSADPNDPNARQIVRHIWDHPDPGAELMRLHDEMTGRGRSSRMPASLNSATPAARQAIANGRRSLRSHDAGGWPVGDDDGDSIDSAAEREIWGATWR
jgi:hypothetical protein